VLGGAVSEGRLFFSTLRGGFSERIVPLQDHARKTAEAILSTIDSCIEQGFLPPSPRQDACGICSFRPVCGPGEERRSGIKDKTSPAIEELIRVRSMK